MKTSVNNYLEKRNAAEYSRSLDTICINDSHLSHKWYHNIKHFIVGLFFGIVFIKAEIISWYRIQEMFRFQSFHMYGVIGSEILLGWPGLGDNRCMHQSIFAQIGTDATVMLMTLLFPILGTWLYGFLRDKLPH